MENEKKEYIYCLFNPKGEFYPFIYKFTWNNYIECYNLKIKKIEVVGEKNSGELKRKICILDKNDTRYGLIDEVFCCENNIDKQYIGNRYCYFTYEHYKNFSELTSVELELLKREEFINDFKNNYCKVQSFDELKVNDEVIVCYDKLNNKVVRYPSDEDFTSNKYKIINCKISDAYSSAEIYTVTALNHEIIGHNTYKESVRIKIKDNLCKEKENMNNPYKEMTSKEVFDKSIFVGDTIYLYYDINTGKLLISGLKNKTKDHIYEENFLVIGERNNQDYLVVSIIEGDNIDSDEKFKLSKEQIFDYGLPEKFVGREALWVNKNTISDFGKFNHQWNDFVYHFFDGDRVGLLLENLLRKYINNGLISEKDKTNELEKFYKLLSNYKPGTIDADNLNEEFCDKFLKANNIINNIIDTKYRLDKNVERLEELASNYLKQDNQDKKEIDNMSKNTYVAVGDLVRTFNNYETGNSELRLVLGERNNNQEILILVSHTYDGSEFLNKTKEAEKFKLDNHHLLKFGLPVEFFGKEVLWVKNNFLSIEIANKRDYIYNKISSRDERIAENFARKFGFKRNFNEEGIKILKELFFKYLNNSNEGDKKYINIKYFEKTLRDKKIKDMRRMLQLDNLVTTNSDNKKKESKKMSKTTMKNKMGKAAVRVATRKASKAVRDKVLDLLKTHLEAHKFTKANIKNFLMMAESLLDSPMGLAGISMLLGLAAAKASEYLPETLDQGWRDLADQVGEELQVEAMSTGLEVGTDFVTGFMMQDIMPIFSDLMPEKNNQIKARVVDESKKRITSKYSIPETDDEEINEEENKVVNFSKKSKTA